MSEGSVMPPPGPPAAGAAVEAPAVEAPAVGTPPVEAPAKPERPEKIDFPGLYNGETRVLLTSLDQLATFDAAKHKGIKRGDFKDEALYYDLKATQYDAMAVGMREKAAESRKIGNVADRGRAKKLLAMQRRMSDLTELLKAEGVDVDALLAAAPTE